MVQRDGGSRDARVNGSVGDKPKTPPELSTKPPVGTAGLRYWMGPYLSGPHAAARLVGRAHAQRRDVRSLRITSGGWT